MFKRLGKALGHKRDPVSPHQGKRLHRENGPGDQVRFTINGQKLPGFFLFFSLLFGGLPGLALFAIFFGTPDPDSSDGSYLFTVLFLTPFFLIGAATFMTGLFLWLGQSVVTVTSNTITVQRKLFGKSFQSKEFNKEHLNLAFEESHESNGVSIYKLTLKNEEEKKKIGVGGSLKEEELLWLERELRQSLGEEAPAHTGVAEAMMEDGANDISETPIDPDYRSGSLSFVKTNSGWEARIKSSTFGALFLMVFASIFFLVGVFMIEGGRAILTELFPALNEMTSNDNTPGDLPPIWFGLIFGGLGFGVFVMGLLLLGYRATISKRHSRLYFQRRWFFFGTSQVHDLADLTKLEPKQTGQSGNVPRYRLVAHFKNGSKVTLVHFVQGDDVGQIYARLREHLP